jgi:arachidonate 15-lipoxygenase
VVQNGAVKGFARPSSRDKLVLALTMVVWNGSAQHAARQARVSGSHAPIEPGQPTARHPGCARWRVLPPLGDYRSNNFPYLAWFRDPAITDNALPRFQDALQEIEAKIEARNAQRRYEYSFLKPSAIPSSINI